MSVPTANALRPSDLTLVATSSNRSTVRAARTRSAPCSAHRRARVVPMRGPPADHHHLVLEHADHGLAHHPVCDLPLPQRDPVPPVRFRDRISGEVRQTVGNAAQVDDFDLRAVGRGQRTRYPLPAELQKALGMSERLDPVRDPGSPSETTMRIFPSGSS